MNYYICNNCFCVPNKTNTPFQLTQCGHIFCTNCLSENENRCLQCKSVGVVCLQLIEPLTSQVKRFFTPIDETLEALKTAAIFQTTQMNIILKRFHELNQKYEVLKQRYVSSVQFGKQITQKYYNLKKEMENVNGQLTYLKLHNNSDKTSIPTSSVKFFNTAERLTLNPYSQCDTRVTNTSSMSSRLTFRKSTPLNIYRIPGSISSNSIRTSRAAATCTYRK